MDESGQVKVQVTWGGPVDGLVFQIAMDSPSVNLEGYDLRQLAVLRTDNGKEVKPIRWDRSKSSNHLSGTLLFPSFTPDAAAVLAPGTQEVSLVIRNVSGVPERIFRWKLAG
ncbi:MAG: hypothetical protein HY326_02110 [Chloroflexi bacterium]|nr:hypothetical protein [Chloroflexota bacterium]